MADHRKFFKNRRRGFFRRIDKFHLPPFPEYFFASLSHAKVMGDPGDEANVTFGKISIYNPEFRVGPMLVGVFQPFVDMANDAMDTFRHYKTREEIRDDAIQPLWGLLNIVTALWTIVWFPFSLVLGTIRACMPHQENDKTLDPRMKKLGYRLGRHALQLLTTIPYIVFTLVRGITQIAFTPLAWVKMIIRGIITSKKGKGLQREANRRNPNQELSHEEIYVQFKRRVKQQYQFLERHVPRRRGLPRIRKINRGLFSPFEMLALFRYPIFRNIQRRFYPDEFSVTEDGKGLWLRRALRIHNPPNIGYSLLGIFQPFVDMAKDVANVGYGYKSTRHVLKDLAQPLRGVGNIIKSLLTLVAVPLFLIGIIIAAIIPWKPEKKSVKAKFLGSLFFGTLLWIPNAAFTFVRGLTQIIFTPLSWLKMALRGILSRKGYQSLKDDRGVRQLINDSESTKKIVKVMNTQTKENDFRDDEDRYLTSVDNELERKARRAQARGRTLPEKLTKMLDEPKPEPVQQYVAENGSQDAEFDTGAQTQEKATVTSDANLAGPEKYRYLTFFKSWMDAPPEEKVPNQHKGADERSRLVYDGK